MPNCHVPHQLTKEKTATWHRWRLKLWNRVKQEGLPVSSFVLALASAQSQTARNEGSVSIVHSQNNTEHKRQSQHLIGWRSKNEKGKKTLQAISYSDLPLSWWHKGENCSRKNCGAENLSEILIDLDGAPKLNFKHDWDEWLWINWVCVRMCVC